MPRLASSLVLTATIGLCAAGCEPLLVVYPGEPGPDEILPPQVSSPTGFDGTDDALGGGSLGDSLTFASLRPKDDLSAPVLPGPGSLEGCAAVTSQSSWCATLEDTPGPGASVVFLGLDDGTTCEPATANVGSSVVGVGSLALQGTTLAWCDTAGTVHSVDLRTGDTTSVASAGNFCGGLTAALGGFAALPQSLGRDVSWYARLSEMSQGNEGQTWPVRPWATRLAGDSEMVLAAWHDTDTITRWLPDGTQLEDLELSQTLFINGFDVLQGDQLAVLDENRTLRVFQQESGEVLDELVLDATYYGLACFPEP